MPRSGWRVRRRSGSRVLVAALMAAALSIACVSAPPDGLPFTPATEPDPGDTLVYIYRSDPLRGVRAADIRIDSQDLGELKSGEYLSFLLAPGQHELGARLRWLQLIPRSWNRLGFLSKPGQTLYLKIWAGYDQRVQPATELRAASGAPANTEVGLFLAERDPTVALAELPAMRRSDGP